MNAAMLTFNEYWEVRVLDLALASLVQICWDAPARIDVLIALSQRVHQVERACFHCLPTSSATPGEVALVNASNLDAMLRDVIAQLTPDEVTQFQQFYSRDISQFVKE